jgi:dUTPase
MYNHGDRDMRFFAGDKITQILIMPVRYPLYVHVTEIKGGERGSDGFGSTGA